jgi:hypothetical protein
MGIKSVSKTLTTGDIAFRIMETSLRLAPDTIGRLPPPLSFRARLACALLFAQAIRQGAITREYKGDAQRSSKH